MSMLNPEYVRQTCKKASESGYFTLLSMKLLNFEIGSSYMEMELPLPGVGLVHLLNHSLEH